MLPFTLSGIVVIEYRSIDDHSPEEAVRSIVAHLKRQKAKRLARFGNRVEFHAGLMRFVSSLNQLVAISHGAIAVQREANSLSIRYELWFTEVLIFATVGVAAVLGPPIMRDPHLAVAAKIAIPAFAWIWLVGGNIASTAFRFPRFLRRAVLEPNKPLQPTLAAQPNGKREPTGSGPRG